LPRGRQVDFTGLSSPDRWKPEFAVPYNQRQIGSKVLISNDLGDWLLLTPAEFRDFVDGRPQPGEPLYEKLKHANFVAAEIDLHAQADRWRSKKQYLYHGPTLHAFVLTHRCNHGCQYCHSSIVGMERTDTDMSIEVAERGVDMAFQSTAWAITIEFQGGEPTANWDVLRHIVEYAKKKNIEAKKVLSFALVTNLSLMDTRGWTSSSTATSSSAPASMGRPTCTTRSASSAAATATRPCSAGCRRSISAMPTWVSTSTSTASRRCPPSPGRA